MTFAELIKSKGFSQSKLSRIAGVSQSNLSIYSNYRETLEASSQVTRIKLARAMDMTVEDFEKILSLDPATIVATNRQSGDFIVTER